MRLEAIQLNQLLSLANRFHRAQQKNRPKTAIVAVRVLSGDATEGSSRVCHSEGHGEGQQDMHQKEKNVEAPPLVLWRPQQQDSVKRLEALVEAMNLRARQTQEFSGFNSDSVQPE